MTRALAACLVALLPGLTTAADAALDAPTREAIGRWLAFQQGLRTVQADFVQVRELRTLKSGLRSEGTVWIDRSGGQFRWQSGPADSPKAVAIKTGDTLTLLQPARRRGERLSLTEAARSGGRGAEAAFDLATGDLPGTLDGLTKQFAIVEARRDGDAWRLRLTPADHRLREALGEVVFLIDAARHHLRGFEMTFRDGSTVRTTFTRQQFNGPLDPALFAPDLTGYDLR